MSLFGKANLPPSIANAKMFTALGLGLACGVNKIQGSTGVTSFLLLSSTTSLLTANREKVNEEEVGGKLPIVMEGMMPALSLFVLIWTLLFNLMA
ncbi:hypothetical protein BCR44DRAFT_1430090 [Catenaria anguillulae PL171]|uniref:Uncharacterized protein n=1 Tax=Catenaria anguillulae PL171 TaxID=765915 RepID=A0A1Y2HTE2_9FUNG|nr:hypothetical protein BCR44DRAFT_1430090 [Catenaria anguillulae PL171]